MKILILLISILPQLVSAETINYLCTYASYSDQKGNHKVKNKFELNFIIDRSTGKSYLIGNNGSAEVKALRTGDQIAFIEITGTGNIITTTIDAGLNTVHSRNSVIFGGMVPSQYYGKFVIR